MALIQRHIEATYTPPAPPFYETFGSQPLPPFADPMFTFPMLGGGFKTHQDYSDVPLNSNGSFAWYSGSDTHKLVRIEYVTTRDWEDSNGVTYRTIDNASVGNGVDSFPQTSLDPSTAGVGAYKVDVMLFYDTGYEETDSYTYVIQGIEQVPDPPLTKPATLNAATAQQAEDFELVDADRLSTEILGLNGLPAQEGKLQAEIDYWQGVYLTQPSADGNIKGTLGYRAGSARDFFSEFANIVHAHLQTGTPPQAEIDYQMGLWTSYAAEMRALEASQRIGIDEWFFN